MPESISKKSPKTKKTPDISEGLSRFSTATGDIGFDELEAILDLLPLELTYVDEFDIIRYFNEPKHRLFARPATIIGQNVELCHQPKSVPAIRKMLQTFRDKTAEEAVMWETIQGRFVHFGYYAVRDRFGAYKGVLEIVTDATALRALTGEKPGLDL